MHDITKLIDGIRNGDQSASDELLPIVYDELRKLAKSRLAREQPGQTLQATALVHEAYVRLVGNDVAEWNGRGHFFAAAAEAMRRILIEQARKRETQKRGAGLRRVELRSDIIDSKRDDKMVLLDRALTQLESEDATKAQLVKLRFFAGLTIRETAKVLGISTSSVDRQWVYVRAWLQRQMATKE